MSLEKKISILYEGKVVKKSLAKDIKTNAVVPTYVLEYLLGQHCASFDEEIISAGLEKVKTIIANNYVNREDSQLIQSRIADGRITKVIDRITARFNADKGYSEVDFTNLGIKKVPIKKEYTDKYPKILTGGIWAIISIGYIPKDGGDSPWIVENIKPIQISNIDFDEYVNLRKEFSTDEWKNLLLTTLGLNIEQFSPQQVLMQLTRLIPFCERNYNIIELGPKGTGKSHVYSEFSPHGILISGGEVTAAKLFVNNTSNAIGLVGVWDTVAFDEFAGKDKKVNKDLVDIMKNYMANKTFSRGKESIGADGSMVFVGNTKHSVPYMMKHADLFDPLPKGYYDSAFLDRIHYYLPGWQMDIIRTNMFSDGFGFIVDYFAEILHHLRTKDYSLLLENHFKLDPSFSTRDKTAIKKTYAGLLKILYPDQNYTIEEAQELIEFAIAGRRRVKIQLQKMDETFREVPVDFSYTNTNGAKKEVITLEEIEYIQQTKSNEELNGTIDSDLPIKEKATFLKEDTQFIKDGQKGFSYQSLFADYLKDATEIHITDPYIRKMFQIKNLFEFIQMVYEQKPHGEEITIKLFTKDDTDEPDQEGNLIRLQESLHGTGINFEYDFDIPESAHDRYIDCDNGWSIVLGRGLDMFQYYEFKNPFNLANSVQEERKCKEFSVTYVKRK